MYENDVTCGDGEDVGIGRVYVGANGVEVCTDGSGAIPIQGRIIATTDDGNLDATHPGDGDTADNCG